ncbi:MAG: ribonuclease HII [Candidatus Dormibacteria bacterium]
MADPGAGSAAGGSICGIDEVGRGSLAGPLVAAAVVLPPEFTHPLLRDSKRLTAAQRELVEPLIRRAAASLMVVEIGPEDIDRHGVGWANREAFERLLSAVEASQYLVDGNLRLATIRAYTSLIGGDNLVPAISAASIVAKVHRDRLMQHLDLKFPGYSWAANKGYGSPAHFDALVKLGPTPHHRLSFLHRQERLPL